MGLELKSVPALLAVVRGKKVDRSDYAGDLPNSASGWSSWNRPLIALACEAASAVASKAVGYALKICGDYLRIHPFMGGEQHSVKYWSWIAYPIWVMGRVASRVNQPELSMACRNWLRAFVAYLGFGATMGPGRTLLDHNLKSPDSPRPLVAKGPHLGSVRFVAWAGKRGWGRTDTDADGSRDKFTHLDSPARGLALSQAARMNADAPKATAKWEREMCAAILERFGGSPWMLSETEAAVLRIYLGNPRDVRNAVPLLHWIMGYSPMYRACWRRYEHGVACLLYEWGESSTAELGLGAGHDDGECIFASAATGLRQNTGGADVVDPGKGKWTGTHSAELRRNDGLHVVQVQVPEKYGAHLYDLETGGTGDTLIRLPDGKEVRELSDLSPLAGEPVPPATHPAVPPVTPAPTTPPKRKRRCGLCDKIRKLFKGGR